MTVQCIPKTNAGQEHRSPITDYRSPRTILVMYASPSGRREKSWLRVRVEDGLRKGLTRAYDWVKVDPQHFLLQLRTPYNLPIVTYDGVFSLPQEQLDNVALDVIQSGMKVAAVEGAGFGIGGLLTI